MTESNTVVTDPLNRVIFLPDPGASGEPYTTFTYAISDEETESAPTAVTISIAPMVVRIAILGTNGQSDLLIRTMPASIRYRTRALSARAPRD